MVGKQWLKEQGWLLLIMATAVTFRLYKLAAIPPGLTHDEADHGITAVSILKGTRQIYFTVGYGREPFFDYATAAVMRVLGPNYMAGRVTAVLFSLILILGMYAWVKLAWDKPTALLTAAGLAVGFWPVMSARQSLRSITLPALFVLAVYFYWRAIKRLEIGDWRFGNHFQSPISNYQLPITNYLLAAIFLGLTFYTYIPARGLWLVFPLMLGYVALTTRPLFRYIWRGTAGMLTLAGLIGLPLFWYLRVNPNAEVRIRELSGPLTAVTQGSFSQLWANVQGGLLTLSFAGDTAWRYNIPGRPFLGPVMSILFYAGLVVAGWYVIRPLLKRRPDNQLQGAASFLALAWLGIGLAPILITGPALSMTQAMGMQPVLYLFPAAVLRYFLPRIARIGADFYKSNPEKSAQSAAAYENWRLLAWGGVVLLFAGTAVMTFRDYFGVWANAPEVRVQYETTMAEAMRYLNEQDVRDTAVSTITPGPFHTPALAAMILQNDAITPRWFDGRTSLIIPRAEESLLIFPGFAPLHPALRPYLAADTPDEILPLRDTDLDRPLTVYRIDGEALAAGWQDQFSPAAGDVLFDDAAQLLGYALSDTAVSPGDTIRLITWWQLQNPVPGLRLFSHISGADGVPFAQADRLDAPGDAWLTGDWLLQVHEIMIPADTAVGQYPLTIGLYTCLDPACEQTQRLPVSVDGQPAGDSYYLTNVSVTR